MDTDTTGGGSSQAAVAAAIEELERDGETALTTSTPLSTGRDPSMASDLFVSTKAMASKVSPSKDGARQVDVEAAVRRMERVEANDPWMQRPLTPGGALRTVAQGSSASSVVLMALVVVVAMTTGASGSIVGQQAVADIVGSNSALPDAFTSAVVGFATGTGSAETASAPETSDGGGDQRPDDVGGVSGDGAQSERSVSPTVRTTESADRQTSTDTRTNVEETRGSDRPTTPAAVDDTRGDDGRTAPGTESVERATPEAPKNEDAADRGRASTGDEARSTSGSQGASDAARDGAQPSEVTQGGSDNRPVDGGADDAKPGNSNDARPSDPGNDKAEQKNTDARPTNPGNDKTEQKNTDARPANPGNQKTEQKNTDARPAIPGNENTEQQNGVEDESVDERSADAEKTNNGTSQADTDKTNNGKVNNGKTSEGTGTESADRTNPASDRQGGTQSTIESGDGQRTPDETGGERGASGDRGEGNSGKNGQGKR